MDKVSPGLSKADREMIVVWYQRGERLPVLRGRAWCVLRIRSKNVRLADQVATDWRKAELDDRQKAICEISARFARTPESVTNADWDALKEHGLDDDDVWDVGAIVGLFGLSNRMAHLANLQPNDEFFSMGR